MRFTTTNHTGAGLNPTRIDFTLSHDVRVSGFTAIEYGSVLLDFCWERERGRLYVTLLSESVSLSDNRPLRESLHAQARSFLCGASRSSMLPQRFDVRLAQCGAPGASWLSFGLMLNLDDETIRYCRGEQSSVVLAAGRQRLDIIADLPGEPFGLRHSIDLHRSPYLVLFSPRLLESIPIESLLAFDRGAFDPAELQLRALQALEQNSGMAGNLLVLTIVRPSRLRRG